MRVALLLAASLLLAGCSTPALEEESAAPTPATSTLPPTSQAKPPETSPPTKPPIESTPVAQLNVTIVGYSFQPPNVLVPVGATVTWSNDGILAHTVTLDDESFDSGTIVPGEKTAHTFSTPGSYAYHCRIHDGMRGNVIVNATKAVPVPPPEDPTPEPPAPEPGRFVVNLTNRQFDPSLLKIPVNSIVEFVNADGLPHTATSDFPLFDSGPMQPGSSYNVTFARANDVYYRCSFHPEMRGSIRIA